MMRAFPALVAAPAVVALLSLACQKAPPPDRVRVELPDIVSNKAAIRPLVRAHSGKTSSTVIPGGYTVRSEAPAVAIAGADGTLACVKNGEAKVVVSVQGVEGRGVLRCRLVARLEVTDLPVLDLKGGAVTLVARAFGPDGAELNDVPILVSPTNRAPLSAKGLEVTPVALGTTDVVVRAGDAQHKFATRVVKTLDLKPASIRGGRRLEFALGAGKYEVEATLEEEKAMRMDWRGARQCAYSATGKVHRSTCALDQKGAVVLDNPAFLETGDTALATDRVSVREVP
jgi:hypothetical protein